MTEDEMRNAVAREIGDHLYLNPARTPQTVSLAAVLADAALRIAIPWAREQIAREIEAIGDNFPDEWDIVRIATAVRTGDLALIPARPSEVTEGQKQ